MGGGGWTRDAFVSYSTTKCRSVNVDGTLKSDYTAQQLYTSSCLNEDLDPRKFTVRECCDSDEHPNTIPVILAIDVTGSMGKSSAEVAKKLNVIMISLYEQVKDVEFCIMAIGDLSYDRAPIQMSQFESDIRIAEHLDKVYFEGGGGGNDYESYTAAWLMGAHYTKLDCWNRGKKGIIITIGDEYLNPYLPKGALERVTGKKFQSDIETAKLYDEVKDKYDVYHINITDTGSGRNSMNAKTFADLIGKEHVFNNTVNAIADIITNIVIDHSHSSSNITFDTEEDVTPSNSESVINTSEMISW